jgi:hypothetical protein
VEGTAVSVEERRSDVPVPAAIDVPAAAVPVQVAPALPASTAAVRAAVSTVEVGRTALARWQSAATELVPQLQYQIARLGLAGQAGLATLVAALVVVVSTLVPAQHALESLRAELMRAQHPSALTSPDQALPRLVASLPTRAQMPAVIGQVYTQAKAAGVPLDVGRYVFTPARSGAIARYDLEFPVKASYPSIRGFINRTLSAVPAAALSKLHVERKSVGDQVVNADIGFVVFVRSE